MTDDPYERFMDELTAHSAEGFIASTAATVFYEEAVQDLDPSMSYYVNPHEPSIRLANPDQTRVLGPIHLPRRTPGELVLAMRTLALMATINYIDAEDPALPLA
jgi:hypothetical protein